MIPTAALAEMVHVTRPGGRVVVADPDQGSLVISVPGVRTELVAAVRRLRRDVGYRNGTLVRDLPRRCAEHGLRDVAIEGFPLVLTDPDDAFGIPTWVDVLARRLHRDRRGGVGRRDATGASSRATSSMRCCTSSSVAHVRKVSALAVRVSLWACAPSMTSRCPTTSSRDWTRTGAPRTTSRSARST